jgi:hypothetical protein
MHALPIWFLVLSLFLPRVALFVAWYEHWYLVVAQPWAAVLWVVLPRVLVLILIHAHQGFSNWFWLHLVAALIVWGGSGHKASQRRRRGD